MSGKTSRGGFVLSDPRKPRIDTTVTIVKIKIAKNMRIILS